MSLRISYELFPPKKPAAERQFWRTVGQIESLDPEFVSLTRGAFGGNADDGVLKSLKAQLDCPVVAHLTTRGATREDLKHRLQHWHAEGIRELVVLRGDGEQREALNSALDLQELAQEVADFNIRVAGYPETHPLANDADSDLAVAKAKSDLGATEILSQFCFDPISFLDYRERCAKAGIKATVVPGILPISNFNSMTRIAKTCGASIPNDYFKIFEGLEGHDQVQKSLGLDLAEQLCEALQKEGVERFHFYTLNIPNFSTGLAMNLLNTSAQPRFKLVG